MRKYSFRLYKVTVSLISVLAATTCNLRGCQCPWYIKYYCKSILSTNRISQRSRCSSLWNIDTLSHAIKNVLASWQKLPFKVAYVIRIGLIRPNHMVATSAGFTDLVMFLLIERLVSLSPFAGQIQITRTSLISFLEATLKKFITKRLSASILLLL